MGRHLEIARPSQPQARLQAVAGRPQFRTRLPLAVFAFIAVCGFLLVNLADPYTTSTSWANPQFKKSGPTQNFKTDGSLETTVAATNRDLYKVNEKVADPVPPPASVAATPAKAAAPAAPSYSGSPNEIGQSMAAARGWTGRQWDCLDEMWTQESHWNPLAKNSIGAYGIPQAYPGNKMALAGADWRTNPVTQIKWGLDYIAGKYGAPCGAWDGYTDSY